MWNGIHGELWCMCRKLVVRLIVHRDLYLWASTIFVSRAFSSKVLSEAIPDETLSEEVSVLLPFIDILNHRPLAKVEWRAGDNDVFFLTLENVAAGEEIANNYGPRNNEQCEYFRYELLQECPD